MPKDRFKNSRSRDVLRGQRREDRDVNWHLSKVAGLEISRKAKEKRDLVRKSIIIRAAKKAGILKGDVVKTPFCSDSKTRRFFATTSVKRQHQDKYFVKDGG